MAVSPIVTVEPRRRKFHKAITLTIPVPKAAQKGMLNQYGGDAPTLRLLCSIAGELVECHWLRLINLSHPLLKKQPNILDLFLPNTILFERVDIFYGDDQTQSIFVSSKKMCVLDGM